LLELCDVSIAPHDPRSSPVVATIGGITRAFPTQGSWTVEDYLDLTDETNHLIEFTDGRIEVLETPTVAHQLIAAYLFVTFRDS
jgi:hypothetical protein